MVVSKQESLRPSELVLRYVESLHADPHGETRLPPVREVAKRLGVGASTVSIVYRSLSESGRIRTEVGNGSFLLPLEPQRKQKEREFLKIGIGLEPNDLDDPQGWRSRVYGGLMTAALRLGQQSSLVPLYINAKDWQQKLKSLDAVVIMPGYLLHNPLVKEATKAGIPVVYFNSPSISATENFVSPDYAGASEVLGRAFAAAGRRDIMLLLSDPWHLMISAHYRASGLLSGLQYGQNAVRFRIEVANGFEVQHGRAALAGILERGQAMPDAIYTTGDFLAMGCVEELEARGICVPGQVSIVGGSGLNLDKYSHPKLTCSLQPYEAIGAELIAMIVRLIENPGQGVPGVVVPMAWGGGATTTAAENRILLV